MSNYALRKTEGPFAAGTRVNIISDNSDGTCTVEVLVDPSGNANFWTDELVFDIEPEDLVQLRSRTGISPVHSRKERRSVLKTLFGNTEEVQNG